MISRAFIDSPISCYSSFTKEKKIPNNITKKKHNKNIERTKKNLSFCCFHEANAETIKPNKRGEKSEKNQEDEPNASEDSQKSFVSLLSVSHLSIIFPLGDYYVLHFSEVKSYFLVGEREIMDSI